VALPAKEIHVATGQAESAAHTRSEVAVGATAWYDDAMQVVRLAQTVSVIVVEAYCTYWPAEHDDAGRHEPQLPETGLYWPGKQDVHWTFEVDVPLTDTYWPALQMLSIMQAIWPVNEAYVPGLQSTHGVEGS